ncbi:unnamed protein product [Clavelina lepadiformis]|uniref:SH3 domain-containing protein n=1 Tax=Clavelina lepadiformis TaxID=159417 RepID=A0ABP0GHD4_CLALP
MSLKVVSMSRSSLAPVRDSGPLGQLQSKADSLKIKVDELTALLNKSNTKSANDLQIIKYHADSVNFKIEASSLLLAANQLQKHDEPDPVTNFDQKKSDEVKRLQYMQARIDKLIDNMEQLQNGKDLRQVREETALHPSQHATNHNREVSADDYDDDEEDDEDDDGDSDDDDKDEEEDLYIVIHEFDAEQEGDLSVQVDEVIDIISKRDDGWWEAENEEGKRGLVPSNYLKCYEEDGEVESEQNQENMETTDQVSDTEATNLRSGKELWKGIQEAVTVPQKTDVTDVLAAMGALPAGFRPSTLHNLCKDPKYLLKSFLQPSLTSSNLSFEDLHWDPALNQVRAIVTRTLRSCKLWKCIMIPSPGTGLEVLSQHVRVAVFDGTKVISNVRTIRAQVTANRPKVWQFSPSSEKVNDMLSNLFDGYSIVRTDVSHPNIGILFELALTYIRNQTGEHGELSCGWVHLKLFDEQGNPIPNKTYELELNGGTPYEHGVAVDPSISRRATTGKFRSLLAANKQPKLLVQIGAPATVKRKYLDLLPSTIVVSHGMSELVAYYRRFLADSLLRDRLSASDGQLVHSSVIATFLTAADYPDIMDAVRRNWSEKVKTLSRGDKRDKENMKNVFKTVIMETAYPLLHFSTLPNQHWANKQVETGRIQQIYQTANLLKQPNGALNYFLSSANDFEPFDISEIAFDPLFEYRTIL